MGRRKKYITEEQVREANRVKAKRYYDMNKEVVNAKNVQRYYSRVVRKLSKEIEGLSGGIVLTSSGSGSSSSSSSGSIISNNDIVKPGLELESSGGIKWEGGVSE